MYGVRTAERRSKQQRKQILDTTLESRLANCGGSDVSTTHYVAKYTRAVVSMKSHSERNKMEFGCNVPW